MPNDPSLGGNYALGLTNPPNLLESMGVPDPHPTEFTPFAEAVGVSGSGKRIQLGRPVVKWRWGLLDQRQYDRILQFVSGGSTSVFIKARVPSGVTPTYTVFSAIAHYPTAASSKPGGLWMDVEMIFTDLTNA